MNIEDSAMPIRVHPTPTTSAKTYLFKDRRDAGKRLAQALKQYENEPVLILALPRGGVPVGYEVARTLHAPLDTIVVRKIAVSGKPEQGVGAIAPGDVLMLNNTLVELMGILQDELDRAIISAMREMERRMAHYKSGEWSPDRRVERVIIVDDGLATGLTARAAIESVKITQRSKKIVLAVPFGDAQIIRELRTITDVICIRELTHLSAVGEWYQKFDQVMDEEVLDLLERAHILRGVTMV